MRKRERQQLIEALIRQKPLANQGQLVAALKQRGCRVTQATVSRDMREMGVQKGADQEGRARYFVPPSRARRDPARVLARVLVDASAVPRRAQNLVVVRSEPGTAPAVGRAIDELDRDDVVGTVAGDDTVLLVMPDNAAAGVIAGYLNELIEGRERT